MTNSSIPNAGFTPGPWGVVLARSNQTRTCRTINGAKIMNDECIHVATIARNADKSVPQKEADANLIAAAPELYEALDRLTTAMDDLDIAGLADEWDASLSALAKARGEA